MPSFNVFPWSLRSLPRRRYLRAIPTRLLKGASQPSSSSRSLFLRGFTDARTTIFGRDRVKMPGREGERGRGGEMKKEGYCFSSSISAKTEQQKASSTLLSTTTPAASSASRPSQSGSVADKKIVFSLKKRSSVFLSLLSSFSGAQQDAPRDEKRAKEEASASSGEDMLLGERREGESLKARDLQKGEEKKKASELRRWFDWRSPSDEERDGEERRRRRREEENKQTQGEMRRAEEEERKGREQEEKRRDQWRESEDKKTEESLHRRGRSEETAEKILSQQPKASSDPRDRPDTRGLNRQGEGVPVKRELGLSREKSKERRRRRSFYVKVPYSSDVAHLTRAEQVGLDLRYV